MSADAAFERAQRAYRYHRERYLAGKLSGEEYDTAREAFCRAMVEYDKATHPDLTKLKSAP